MNYCTLRNSGFTLIELMVVVAVIATLAAVTRPFFRGYIDEAKSTEARENLASIGNHAAEYFRKEHYFDTNGVNKKDGIYPGCQATDNVSPTACGATTNSCLGLTIKPNQRIDPTTVNWDTQPWTRLGFAIGGPMFYCYSYTTNNAVTTFEAKATGSLSAANDSEYKISGDADGKVTAVMRVK